MNRRNEDEINVAQNLNYNLRIRLRDMSESENNEQTIIDHLIPFLIELGKGFAADFPTHFRDFR